MSGESISLVFVHGFQGDHTSFQAFPTHLHLKVVARIPQLQTYVYPTYKARKPLQSATKDLVKWMEKTLPNGPVILLGHSMGGLLIAEAAFDEESEDRIIGLTSFDVPFIGIHPHVIVSGLASLFKGKEGESEQDVNDHNAVNVDRPSPSPRPSSIVEKQQHLSAGTSAASTGLSSGSVSPLSALPRPPSVHLSAPPPPRAPNPTLSAAFQLLNLGEPSEGLVSKLHWLNKHRSKPFSAFGNRIWETLEFSSCLLDPVDLHKRYQRMVQWGRRPGKAWVNYWTETVPKLKAPDQPEAPANGETSEEIPKPDDPEHGAEEEEYHTPDEGDFEENTETFQMAALLTTPDDVGSQSGTSSSSKETPSLTSTSTSVSEGASDQTSTMENTEQPDGQTSTPEEEKAKEKVAKEAKKERERAERQARKEQEQKEKEERKAREQVARETKKAKEKLLKEAQARKKKADEEQTPRHFIVLPSRPTKEWPRVPIEGADDEVEAHCGLFFKDTNYDYDGFVDTVSTWIVDCWERSQGQGHQRT